MFFEKVAVLGVGLIGASVALSMKKRSLCGRVSGYGRTGANLERARQRGIIDSCHEDPRRACEGADLIVMSVPVGRLESLASEIADSVPEGVLVVDVGSVKGRLSYSLESILTPRARFVGCHPIAGSERSGIDPAREDLFEGAMCIVTRTQNTDAAAFETASSLWSMLGSKVIEMDPDEHDRVFGLVSHMPHMAAYALVNAVSNVDGSALKYAGQGFMDATRIALSNPKLWSEICSMNRENLLFAINSLKETLEDLRRHLSSGDVNALEREFEKARDLRRSIAEEDL